MYKRLPTDRLHEMFSYEDGKLFWKVQLSPSAPVGSEAGCYDANGYSYVRVNGSKYAVHRMVYQMHGGNPEMMVDHIDGNPSNNAIENLRGCCVTENQQNRKINANNTSGFKNVYRNNANTKWNVVMRINGKKKFFGGFEDVELADLVAQEARNKYHGDFANHGKHSGV